MSFFSKTIENHNQEACGPHRSPEKHFIAKKQQKPNKQTNKTSHVAHATMLDDASLNIKKPEVMIIHLPLNLSQPILGLSHIRTCMPAMTKLNR